MCELLACTVPNAKMREQINIISLNLKLTGEKKKSTNMNLQSYL